MTSSSNQTSRPPIAVVGVSALFPGSTDSTGFWNDILAGTDRMTDVPPSHWLVDDHFDADMTAPDKTYGRRGGFLDTVDLDAMQFGIPPSSVDSTDTAQLLALIVAQRVLDDAIRGQFSELDRSRASVILGVTSGQELFGSMVSRMNRPLWLQGMRRAGVPEDAAQAACDRIADLHPEWTEATFPGLLGNVVAGRIANRLDLGGTNCVTDAACASSFSAISMGVNELYLGDSDLVIAGGVDTMNDVFMYMCFSKTPALSKSEEIRPFSDQADGTMLGEGLGMFALKRVEDAERDGNDIYAVINGVGSSSDGRSKSVYAPVSSGQARALGAAYAKAGYGPETVELVEAHGTGTVAGDAAEFGGLELAFGASGRVDRQWCALGSVKSQIGHTKAAAGAAGLFKAIMAVHHKVLPQTAKIERPNPQLELERSPFHLNTHTRPWVRNSDHTRRASVSSFGFGGSNFHITLSEYSGPGTRAPRLRTAGPELVVVHGTDPADLVAAVRDRIDESSESGALARIAHRSQVAHEATAAVRLAVVANDEHELRERFAQAVERIEASPDEAFTTPTGVSYGVGGPTGDVAFVFPGQGSQYVSMGSAAVTNFDAAMAAWDLAADCDRGDVALAGVVFPITTFAPDAAETNAARLTRTEWAQPAIGVTSLALLQLLRSIGVRAAAVGGHSFGEITALHAAGVLSAGDMIDVARERGELMADAARTPGSMTAVVGSIDEVRAIVEESGADVVVANHNGPTQVVLSGATSAIDGVEAHLRSAGMRFTRLPVATAFHSPIVSGASSAFATFLDGVHFEPPTVPAFANATAGPYPSDPEEMRAQLSGQIASSVRFVEMIEAMYDAGARTFVEVGPGSVLTSLIGRILDGREHQAIPLDKQHADDLTPLLRGLGRLAAAGVEMDLRALWSEYDDPANAVTASAKLAIPINGANTGAPYPPHDLSKLVGPNPTVTAPPIPSIAAPPEQSAPTAAVTVAEPAAAPTPTAAAATPTASVGVLAAYQAAQQQTADAHTTYLDSMARSHTAFLDAAQESLAVLGRLAGVGVPAQAIPQVAGAPVPAAAVPQPAPIAVPPTPAPAPVAPPREPVAAATLTTPIAAPVAVDMTAVMLTIVADRTGYPADILTMEMELEADLGIDSIKRVEILSAVQDAVPELPDVDLGTMAALSTLGEIVDYLQHQATGPHDPPTPPPNAPAPIAATPIAAPVAVDMTAVMLTIVADRTGYPADILTMEMELEADLGIDSIKRVEILSAVQDAVPELPDVDLGTMAALSTLGEIVDYLQHQATGPHDPPTPPPNAPAPIAATPIAAPVAVDMTAVMLTIVADRTGYPADILTMEMELEADLGIDSIKRVEILSAVQDAVPELPDVDLGTMAALSTLGEIVDYLQHQATGPHDPPTPPPDALAALAAPTVDTGAANGSGSFGRHVIDVVEVPIAEPVGPLRGLRGRRVHVLDGGSGVGDALVAALTAAGVDAHHGDADSATSGASVVLLTGLRHVEDPDEAMAVNRDAFTVAQRFSRGAAGGAFVVVSALDGRFGSSIGDATTAWTAGLTGLARTAAIEWSGTTVKSIDVERGDRSPEAIADAISTELLTGGDEREVGLALDGCRYSIRSVRIDVETGPMPIGADDVIVVAGGGRGVTAATTIELARISHASFVLLGRSRLVEETAPQAAACDDASLKRVVLDGATAEGTTLTPNELSRIVDGILAGREVRDTIAAIERSGGTATYVPVDITDASAVTDACSEIRDRVGPITGVVHGAGVLADKLIVDKTAGQFDLVFDTKVVGLRNLLAATSVDDLRLLCLFSSVAAHTGNAGQVDYAMANEILNKVAVAERQRRGSSCVVKALGWGPWAGGMVTPSLKSHFETMGVELIDLDAGAAMFVDEISSLQDEHVEVLLGGGVRPPADTKPAAVAVGA